MRNPLNKRLPREFRTNAAKYIGIFLILVCTIMVGSAFQVSLSSTERTLAENEKTCKTEDGYFETTDLLSDEIKEKLEDTGIFVAENFYSTVKEYEETAKILIFNERTEFNLPSIVDGSLPAKENEIAMERLFAQNRNIHIGDTLTLHGKDFTVTGTIALPDYTSLFKSNQDLVMNNTDFGLSLVTEEGFKAFEKDTLTYRYSYRYQEDDLTDNEKWELVEDVQTVLVENGVVFETFLTAENNQSISFLKNDMGKDGPMMNAFIYILIVIIAFIFSVLTSNSIEAEATIIGTLRASGYTKSEIIFHYLSPTILVALASSLVGNVLGYTVILEPFMDIYYTSYALPTVKLQFNLEAFMLTTVIPVLLMIFINWWMLYNKLSLSPLKFLRKDLKKRKQKKAVHLPNFSFLNRFRLRVLLQNKVSYLILFFGIFLSSFLLMFGIGLEPIFDHYTDTIDQTLPYDYQYILKMPVENEDGEKLLVYNMDTWYEFGKTDVDITFMGVSKNNSFFEHISLPEKEDEMTISTPFAKKFNLKVGDEVVFSDTAYDKEYTLKVAGICDYSANLGVFMTQENLNKLLDNDADTFNCYVSDEKLDIDETYIAKYITRSDMVGATKQMMESFETVMMFINVFSVVVYMVFMYILTKTVIEKNALSISFMKVFGYSSQEINKLYLNATTFTVLTSLFICIPLEILCYKYVLVYVSSMTEGYIDFYLPAWVYAAIIGTGIIAYFIINAIHVHKIRKIPMSEALKNRE